MPASSSLTCNFSISSSLDLGVSFASDNGGASYGGQISIFTPPLPALSPPACGTVMAMSSSPCT